MTANDLSREELYTFVWNKPVSHLAAEWGVKGWDILKWCKQKNIPLPGQGHWSRLKHGKPVEQTPLPPATANEEVSVKEQPQPEPEPPVKFAGESHLSFAVPDRLIHPDKLIIAAQQGLSKDRWGSPAMARTDDDQIAIRVMPVNVGRALRIMDTLINSAWIGGEAVTGATAANHWRTRSWIS